MKKNIEIEMLKQAERYPEHDKLIKGKYKIIDDFMSKIYTKQMEKIDKINQPMYSDLLNITKRVVFSSKDDTTLGNKVKLVKIMRVLTGKANKEINDNILLNTNIKNNPNGK